MTYYVDPGTTKGCAVARTFGGQIIGLAIFRGPAKIKSWGGCVGFVPTEPTYWEKPQLYPDELRHSTPQKVIALANDLIELAACGADTVCALAGLCPVIAKYPRQWKAQTPKPIHHARLLGRLTVDEMRLAVEAYGRKDPQALGAYVKAACIATAKNREPSYKAEITDLLDAMAFALTIEGRL